MFCLLVVQTRPLPASAYAHSQHELFLHIPAADVLEYLWWITSHSKVVYNILYGDKDTFSLAFAAAGEAMFVVAMYHVTRKLCTNCACACCVNSWHKQLRCA